MDKNSSNISIGIADDHLLILNGLEMMLAQSNFQIIFKVLTAAALQEQLQQHVPDVLLLDIELPDGNGIELCKSIASAYPNLKIIALTNHAELVYVRKMMRSGAAGYLLKGTTLEELTKAIEQVHNGGQYINRQLEQALLQETLTGKKQPQTKLTRRESEVLELIASECTNQEIAAKLYLSVRTVESHRLSLSQKLNAKNTASLVKEAYLRGLIK